MKKRYFLMCGSTFGWVASSIGLAANGMFNAGSMFVGALVLFGWLIAVVTDKAGAA